MHFLLCESKRLLKFTGLKGLMHENEDIQGYIANPAPLGWQRKKMKHSLNLLLLLNSFLFYIVRRNHSISGEDGKHGNYGAASADFNIILFLTIYLPDLLKGLK